MAEQKAPSWAYDRLGELSPTGHTPDLIDAFARYIAEHEEAPVDPCVVEGRKLVAETQHDWPEIPWHVGEAAETIAGNRDYTLVVQAAIEGVRRGIEIGKAQA